MKVFDWNFTTFLFAACRDMPIDSHNEELHGMYKPSLIDNKDSTGQWYQQFFLMKTIKFVGSGGKY